MVIKLKGKSIGIDLGHCETTFSHPSLNGDKLEVMLMKIDGYESIMLTQVLLTNDQMLRLKNHKRPDREVLESLGEIRIGTLPASAKDGEVFRYFKVSPEEFDKPCAKSAAGIAAGITHGQVTACFMYAALMSALKHNTNVSPDELDQLTLYVGCPATGRWTQKEPREEYAKLLKTATGVKAVEIVPESRAALFSSLENRRYKALSAADGVVVFDFGSSTADCTFMRLGKGSLEFSWTLGAHAIEENMVRLVLKQIYESKGYFTPDEESLQAVSNECRKFKESYYKGEFGPDGHEPGFVFRDQAATKHKDIVLIDDAFMKRAVEEVPISVTLGDGSKMSGSWREICRAFMEFARGEMKRGGFDASTAVLTGGASRMPFIEELCREVFGAGMDVLREKTPSFTVSSGLATVAVVENNYGDCVTEALEQVKKMPGCTINDLLVNIRNDVYTEYKEAMLFVANEWMNGEGDDSVSHLYEMMKAHMKEEEIQSRFVSCISGNIEGWKENLGERISEAVNAQAEQLLSQEVAGSMMLGRDLWKDLNADNIEFDVDVEALLKDIDLNSSGRNVAMASTVVGSAAGGAATGAEVGASFGPVGAVIGAAVGGAIGLAAGIFGAEVIDDNDPSKPRESKWRKDYVQTKLLNQIEKPENEAKITSSIDQSMINQKDQFDKLLKKTVRRAMDIVTLRTFSI